MKRKFLFACRSFSALPPVNDQGHIDAPMDPKRYPEWQANLLKFLVSTTKAASAVGSQDISFERSIDSEFDSSLTTVTDRLLILSNRLLKFSGLHGEEFED